MDMEDTEMETETDMKMEMDTETETDNTRMALSGQRDATVGCAARFA